MHPRKDILEFGRRDKPFREVQISALKWFQENYETHDVFVFEAPTATGKSLIVTTIANWLSSFGESVSVITPTKILQDQYLSDFDDIPVLKGQASYSCTQMGLDGTCRDTKQHVGNCCVGENGEVVCPYLGARGHAAASSVALFNFHSYYANKMYKNGLMADEAHNVIGFLFDFYHIKLWKCEIGYDDSIELKGASIKILIDQAVRSLSMELVRLTDQGSDSQKEKLEKEIERYGYIRDSIDRFNGDLLIEKVVEEYRGTMKEFRKTNQEYIYVKPLRVDKIGKDILWPDSVKKVILLSATINEEDSAALGLNAKRVAHYKCDSTIPAERRPFMIWGIGSMKYSNRAATTPKIIQGIKKLSEHHVNEKGIVHCTYDMATKIRATLGHDPRFWFHDKMNKTEMYNKFRAAPGNPILIACGMEEGIDLAFDAGRWQVITQIMRPNIQDLVNKWMMFNNKRFYNWEAVRKIIQQTGRICRDPTDFGITYMLDGDFMEFMGETRSMWPKWFVASMRKLAW